MVKCVLVGNKSDCSESERQVTAVMGETLAATKDGIPFFESSAKKNENIAEVCRWWADGGQRCADGGQRYADGGQMWTEVGYVSCDRV